MIDREQIIQRFRSLSVWNKGGQRAPHKPLLCLLAISKIVDSSERMIPFQSVEKTLIDLLMTFGPPRKVCHPEYPFWALQNEDSLWEFRSRTPVTLKPGSPPTKAVLLRAESLGGFQIEVFDALKSDELVRAQVIDELLAAHFPESIHDDIMEFLNLEPTRNAGKRGERDPQFREKVLSAYEYRCAVFGYNLTIGHVVVGLEAAHIKWIQAGGPNIHVNGLALCTLHHKLFDRGAFTVDIDHRALVSEKVYGTDGFTEHLGRYHKQPLFRPIRESYNPTPDFLKWHFDQVFQLPSRE